MDLDDVSNSDGKVWRTLCSNRLQYVRSAPEIVNLEAATSEFMQLDFIRQGPNRMEIKTETLSSANDKLPTWTSDGVMLPEFESNRVEIKPHKNAESHSTGRNKFPTWTYEGVIPEFGPKKFQRKESTITRPPEEEKKNSSGGYRLGTSVGVDFFEPIPLEDVYKVTPPSQCLDGIEMELNSVEPMSSEVGSAADFVFSSIECLNDIEMEQPLAKSSPRKIENVTLSESLNITQSSEISSSNTERGVKRKYSALQTEYVDGIGTAQETTTSISNEVKDDCESTLKTNSKRFKAEESDDSVSLTECMENMKMEQEFLGKFISEVKDEELILKTSFETTSEYDRNVSLSTQKSVGNEKRGEKRKISEKSNRKEPQISRRSDRIKSYSSPPLILDRPRRSNAAYNSKK